MKVAYVFSSAGQTIDYVLGDMILPQLERGEHGVDVVGMFFFHDNTYALRSGDPLGERLAAVADEQDILLMLCDQCASKRGLAERVGEHDSGRARFEPSDTVDGATVGCFPDLYAALGEVGVDHVITL
jgi:sulfur relay (sulfurtransferase) complex TusBCD TusD component (DsrE family)